jgi:hypothetical protein
MSCSSEHIAGDLFHDEPIVGLVFIEGADHVIAVRPGIRPRRVHLETRRLREAHHIQPMPRPALAITRRREQLLHESGIGIPRLILHERLHFLRRGRQADQIKVKPANERAPICFRRKLQLVLGQLRRNEPVDGIGLAARWPLRRWNGRPNYGLEGPMRFLFHAAFRPGRALIDPRAQQPNLFGGQRFALGRHLHLLHRPGDKMNERALGTVLRLDRRRVILAALERRFLVIQPQSPALLVRIVTLQAMRFENRPHLAHEIHRARECRRQLRRIHRSSLGREQDDDGHHEQRLEFSSAPHSSKTIQNGHWHF